MATDPDRSFQAGTITKMEAQKNDADRMSIFIDDAFAFGLHQDIVVKYRLGTGQYLSAEEQRELVEADQVVRAKGKALDYLAHKPRTETEVRRKLQQKDYAPSVVHAVIDQLMERGYLDDESYAFEYVQRRFSHKGYGPVRLQAELKRRGIDRTLAEQAIEALFETEDQLAAARQKAEARWPRIAREDDPRKRRDKLYRYLRRRGFTYDVIRQVIDEMDVGRR